MRCRWSAEEKMESATVTIAVPLGNLLQEHEFVELQYVLVRRRWGD